jgi:hypothetical protein
MKNLLVNIWEFRDKKVAKSGDFLRAFWSIFWRKKLRPKLSEKMRPKTEKCAQTAEVRPIWSHCRGLKIRKKSFRQKKNNQLTSNLKKNRWLDAQNLSRKLYALIHPLCDKFRKIDFRPNLNYLLEGKTTNTQLPIH